MTRGPSGLLFTVVGSSADMTQPPLFAWVW
jgi:hypothetical protein